MIWQQRLVQDLGTRLPAGARLEVVGSALDPSLVDGWSDLDLHLRLPRPVGLVELLPGQALWAAEVSEPPEGQLVRAVLADGRRLDLLVEVGRLLLPSPAPDADVRFLAALAVSRLGRGDHLVGMHLVLELVQHCLVQAMLLRDRDEGTRIHRTGTTHDRLAAEVARTPPWPGEGPLRPDVVQRVVELYGRWRGLLETGYEPDWSGLTAVIDRGLAWPGLRAPEGVGDWGHGC